MAVWKWQLGLTFDWQIMKLNDFSNLKKINMSLLMFGHLNNDDKKRDQ